MFAFLLICILALALTFYSAFLTAHHFSQPPPHLDAPFALYPVTVLKPLKGVDAGIEENLCSFFRQDYPIYEILFSVASKRDPVCEVVRKLMACYPQVRARLVIGSEEIGP